MIVENHPGAGGTAAPALVAKSPADGYTWLVNTSAQAYSATFVKNLPYDPLKDFIPVAPLTSQPYVLVAGKTSGITTVAELIAAAKANPGALKFGSAGVGTGTHMGIETFNLETGIRAVHVPGETTPAAIAEAVGGRTAYLNCAHFLRPGRYTWGEAARAWRDNQEAFTLATGRADDFGGRRRRLRLSDLVRRMGARSHSIRSGGQTSAGHRACHGRRWICAPRWPRMGPSR